VRSISVGGFLRGFAGVRILWVSRCMCDEGGRQIGFTVALSVLNIKLNDVVRELLVRISFSVSVVWEFCGMDSVQTHGLFPQYMLTPPQSA